MNTFRLLLLSPLIFFVHVPIATSQAYPFQSFLHPKDEVSERAIYDFDISSDEQYLATTNTGPNVYIWSIKNGSLVTKITETENAGYPMKCRFSNDGRMMSSSGFYGDANIWDLQTGKKIKTLHHVSDPVKLVSTLAFSLDNKTLLTTVEGDLFFWNVENGELESVLENVGVILSAQYLPNGNLIFINELSAGLVFDISRGGVTRRFDGDSTRISTDSQIVTTFHSTGNNFGNIKEWDVASGALIYSATQVEFEPGSIVSPDNDFVFYPDKVEKNKIKISKLKEKSPFIDLNLNAFPALNVEQPYRMELSKKGHFLFFSQGNNAFLYDIRELKSKIKDDKVYDDPPKQE